MENPIVSWLFETDAVRVCPEGQPFWYTSGKLGPFYINTQFLYGSEEAANALRPSSSRLARAISSGFTTKSTAKSKSSLQPARFIVS